MSETLFTLIGRCQHHEEIKKSRFRAIAAPVTSPDEAMRFLHEVADPVATHNCWAYRIGQDYRFNDDGEPGGTAGRPILQAIEGQQMDGVAVQVTRWYGGIKLGAGGLVRAYGGTAAECLRLAERVEIVATTCLLVQVEFAELALLKARLRELQADIAHEDFGARGVTLQIVIADDRISEAQQLVSDITRGRSQAKPLG